jgi:hypothetical protein
MRGTPPPPPPAGCQIRPSEIIAGGDPKKFPDCVVVTAVVAVAVVVGGGKTVHVTGSVRSFGECPRIKSFFTDARTSPRRRLKVARVPRRGSPCAVARCSERTGAPDLRNANVYSVTDVRLPTKSARPRGAVLTISQRSIQSITDRDNLTHTPCIGFPLRRFARSADSGGRCCCCCWCCCFVATSERGSADEDYFTARSNSIPASRGVAHLTFQVTEQNYIPPYVKFMIPME